MVRYSKLSSKLFRRISNIKHVLGVFRLLIRTVDATPSYLRHPLQPWVQIRRLYDLFFFHFDCCLKRSLCQSWAILTLGVYLHAHVVQHEQFSLYDLIIFNYLASGAWLRDIWATDALLAFDLRHTADICNEMQGAVFQLSTKTSGDSIPKSRGCSGCLFG